MLEETPHTPPLAALVFEHDRAMAQRLHRVLEAADCPSDRIAHAESTAQAREIVAEGDFDLVLVDIDRIEDSGTELIAWIRQRHAHIQSIAMSNRRDDNAIIGALRAGATGYLIKERDDAELAMALRSIGRGGAPIDPCVARRVLAFLASAVGATAGLPPRDAAIVPDAIDAPILSVREQEILNLVAQGLSNREMADQLSISKATVECHTKNIYRKLVVGSRTEAVFLARQHGLLS